LFGNEKRFFTTKEFRVHSTNYYNAFIEIAEDCPTAAGEVPPVKGNKKSVANLQFEMLDRQPYKYTSDDVFFSVFATRNEIPAEDWPEKREEFFTKGQPCFRASPLTKRYGWGVHSNEDGKIAIYGAGSEEYQQFLLNETVEKKKAMRNKRA